MPSSARILIVDDDSRFLRLITEILIGAGYDAKAISDPLAAPKLAEEFKPHLLILDIAMPGKDGIDLASEFKSNPKMSGTPVMFLTARRAADGMGEAKDAGAIAYLEKPVQSSKLLWMVSALLKSDLMPP